MASKNISAFQQITKSGYSNVETDSDSMQETVEGLNYACISTSRYMTIRIARLPDTDESQKTQ